MEKHLDVDRAMIQLKAKGIEHIASYHGLKQYTTWQIGGIADIFIQPRDEEDIIKVLKFADEEQLPLHIIGRGSNILISDHGLRGIVLALTDHFNTIQIEGKKVRADAGALIKDVVYQSAEQGLAGLEFAEGIPGSIGGGLIMNAGAYGGYLSDCIEMIICCDRSGQQINLHKEDAHFDYRSSIFKQRKDLIILKAIFLMDKDNPKVIREKIDVFHEKRHKRQPLELPSAGSVFKNPPGLSVAQIIESVGAKGWRVGDAQISTKHSNFIVNLGNATCQDVLDLIEKVRQAVKVEYGINLETEILVLGNQ